MNVRKIKKRRIVTVILAFVVALSLLLPGELHAREEYDGASVAYYPGSILGAGCKIKNLDDNTMEYIYCINPTRGAYGPEGNEANYRARYDLATNGWRFNNSQNSNENTGYRITADELKILAKVLYAAHEKNANGEVIPGMIKSGYSVKNVQEAVFWAVMYGKGDPYDETLGQIYRAGVAKVLIKAAAEVTDEQLGDWKIWFYRPRVDAGSASIQNMVNLTNKKRLKVQGRIKFEKKLLEEGTGTPQPMTAGQFKFKVTGPNGGLVGYCENDENGVVFSPAIEFNSSQLGTHRFTITEVSGDDPNITYDDRSFQLDLHVTLENGVLKLSDWKGVFATSTDNSDCPGTTDGFRATFENEVKRDKPEPEMGTTVSVDGNSSTIDKPITVSSNTTVVTDTIQYSNMTPGATYTVTGKLMKVNGNSVTQVATTSKQCKASNDGQGTWEIVFQNLDLEANAKYVVYEYAVNNADSNDKAEHANPEDNAQTFLTKDTPSMSTTVSCNGVSSTPTSSITLPYTVTSVKDTIAYKGMTPGVTYFLKGELMEIGDEIKKVATTYGSGTADASGEGTWELEFTNLNLKPDTKYVVYETAINTNDNSDNATHANPDDKAQTFFTKEAPHLSTTVKCGTESSSDTLSIVVPSDKTKVADIISYSNLTPGATYNVTGKLMKIVDGTATQVATSNKSFTASSNGSGEWTLEFNNLSLEPNAKYVVYEYAVNANDANDTAKHENPNDKAQTFTTKEPGKMSTTVSYGDTSSTSTKPITVLNDIKQIIDTIAYEDLTPGATYNVTGKLMKVDNGTVTHVATSTQAFIANAQGAGQWNLVFSDLDLEPNAKYVVYEYAENATNSNDTAKHENPDDKAQTFFTKEPGSLSTSVRYNGISSTDEESIVISKDATYVRDAITYTNLTPNTRYNVTGKLMEVESEGSLIEVASRTAQRATPANSGSGVWYIDFTDLNLDANKKYVVFEYAVSQTNPNDTVKHEDPTDKAQTFFTKDNPVISTTVSCGSDSSTADNPMTVWENVTEITDTIYYENMTPGKTYNVTGRLMKIVDGTAEEVATATSSFTADNDGVGEWTLPFTGLNLEPNTKYVVYEYAENANDSSDNATHENPNDTAQTFFTRELPSMRTTVSHGDESSTSNSSITVSKDVTQIIDTITYQNMTPGVTYNVTGKLMKIDGNSITEVKTVTGTFTASDTGNGEWKVVFSDLELDANAKYVVYEYAENPNNSEDKAQHENPEDKAQTFFTKDTPSMRTTVSYNGKSSTPERSIIVPQTATEVVDTISYDNMTPGATYEVTGRLMEVETSGSVIEVATTTGTFTADSDGKGEWQVTFSGLQLKADTKYVVYEYAVNKNNSNDTAKHENPDDKAQTFLTNAQDIVISKNVTGILGDRTKEFEFTITLTDLDANSTYHVTGSGNMVSASVGTMDKLAKTIKASNEGKITLLVKLTDDQDFCISGVPVDAKYKVSEAASDHVASYDIEASKENANIVKPSDANEDDKTALATETETVEEADGTVVIEFTNDRDLEHVTGVPTFVWGLLAAFAAAVAAMFATRKRRRC